MSEERGYSGSAVALGFILGGVLGASLAMLLAPESGRRTRERLRDLAADIRDKTADFSEDLRDKAEDAVEHHLGKFTLASAARDQAAPSGLSKP